MQRFGMPSGRLLAAVPLGMRFQLPSQLRIRRPRSAEKWTLLADHHHTRLPIEEFALQ